MYKKESRFLDLYIDLSSNQITTIPSYAFYNFTSFHVFTINNNPIKKIKNFAFASKHDLDLSVDLHNNIGRYDFNTDVFEPLSLAGIDRPAQLNLRSKSLKTLKQEVFSLYFLWHSQHNIAWFNDGITCDCSMFWLKARKELFRRQFDVTYEKTELYCDGFNKTEIWDMNDEDFGNCTFAHDAFDFKYHLIDGKERYYI